MNKSDSISNLAAAMAKAQPLIEGASKDKNNPAFRSKYADLASVTEALSIISAHGLSYVQISHDHDNAASVETIILHTSGEWLGCGPVSVPVTKGDAHGFGSALTYARRYSLSSAFGVVPEDDDGNAAAKARPIVSQATRPGDGNQKITALAASEDAFKVMGEEEQKFLRGTAANMTALHEEERVSDAYNLFAKLDEEEKLAIWHLFGSKARDAFKTEGDKRKPAKAAA